MRVYKKMQSKSLMYIHRKKISLENSSSRLHCRRSLSWHLQMLVVIIIILSAHFFLLYNFLSLRILFLLLLLTLTFIVKKGKQLIIRNDHVERKKVPFAMKKELKSENSHSKRAKNYEFKHVKKSADANNFHVKIEINLN